MGEEKKLRAENNLRVTFGRGYDVCIMGIDGTWRRDCLLKAVSDPRKRWNKVAEAA